METNVKVGLREAKQKMRAGLRRGEMNKWAEEAGVSRQSLNEWLGKEQIASADGRYVEAYERVMAMRMEAERALCGEMLAVAAGPAGG